MYKTRLRLMMGALAILFATVLCRVGYLQTVKGADYRRRAVNLLRREIDVESVRGAIVTADGTILAENVPIYDVAVIPRQLLGYERGPEDPSVVSRAASEILDDLAALTAEDPARLRALVTTRFGDIDRRKTRSEKVRMESEPFTIIQDVQWHAVIEIESCRSRFRGVVIRPRAGRRYPERALACHIVGYTGKFRSKDEWETYRERGYKFSDAIGRGGIEQEYEEALRGKRGRRVIEHPIDSDEVDILLDIPAIKGETIVLTIDAPLQRRVREILGARRGAVVVLDARKGDVRAMVSAPGFDPGRPGPSLAAAGNPFLNRAMRSAYPPGSIFKIVTLLAASSTAVSPNEQITCTGSHIYGGRSYACWYRAGHGPLDAVEALKHSCNCYFYEAGRRATPTELHRWARRLGLGQPTGIDMPREAAGIVPAPGWLTMHHSRRWTVQDTVSMSIGQSYLLVTPLQAARMMAFVATGQLPRPRLNARREIVRKTIPVAPAALAAVRDGMYAVVNAPGGTGYKARTDAAVVYGKTGTAQVGGGRTDHAWFAGYASVGGHLYAVSVFLEHGGAGGHEAAPVGKAVFEAIAGRYNEEQDAATRGKEEGDDGA